MAHALLSPSSASRWLYCTPSARLEAECEETKSAVADEGTAAHRMSEIMLHSFLFGPDAEDIAEVEGIEKEYPGMSEYVDQYTTWVIEQYNTMNAETSTAVMLLEEKLDLAEYVPESFGTSDVVIVGGNKLHIIDLKYGKGVPVSAIQNKQMYLYALGAIRALAYGWDIEIVKMSIYQPRIDNYSTYEITTSELLDWADNQLRVQAHKAFAGEGEFVPGVHCQFCKVKPRCRALHDQNLLLAQMEFRQPPLLNDEEIVDVLNVRDQFINWIKSVDVYALGEALKGKVWPGYKLVEGRSARKITDEENAAIQLTSKGFTEIYNKKLKGIGELEKLVGKKQFPELLGPYVAKPPGKPALVPEADKRPAISSADAAAADFSDDYIDE
ncbi:MAG: DUF2800 domain-containing protein [Gammaproteobacteria bacterium]|nr:DUF2800 domain-containing protein [Gammaproteobacteria bacterium]